MKYYLAYGSNLHVAQMKRRCPGAHSIGTAWLEGWRLAFRGSKTGAYLTIIRDSRARTPVGVWQITDEDEKALDYYEGYPRFYGKAEMTVDLDPFIDTKEEPRAIKAVVYIMDPHRPAGVPSRMYVDTCSVGYACFGFSKEPLLRAVSEALGAAPKRRKKVTA